MACSSIFYVMLLALLFGFVAAKCPSPAPGPVSAHSPSYPSTDPPANAPVVHSSPSHAPKHSVYSPSHAPRRYVYPPTHAPSRMKTPSASAPSPVFHSAPTKSPAAAETPSISMPPSYAPAPAENAGVYNRFSAAGFVTVGVLAALLLM